MTHHHAAFGFQLRVTVSFPIDTTDDIKADSLNDLMLEMKQGMGFNERLTRLSGMQQTEGPLRVFHLEFSDPDRFGSILRSVGGWYMRHSRCVITLRADGPEGGVNLQLKEFSTVAFAQAAGKIGELIR